MPPEVVDAAKALHNYQKPYPTDQSDHSYIETTRHPDVLGRTVLTLTRKSHEEDNSRSQSINIHYSIFGEPLKVKGMTPYDSLSPFNFPLRRMDLWTLTDKLLPSRRKDDKKALEMTAASYIMRMAALMEKSSVSQ